MMPKRSRPGLGLHIPWATLAPTFANFSKPPAKRHINDAAGLGFSVPDQPPGAVGQRENSSQSCGRFDEPGGATRAINRLKPGDWTLPSASKKRLARNLPELLEPLDRQVGVFSGPTMTITQQARRKELPLIALNQMVLTGHSDEVVLFCLRHAAAAPAALNSFDEIAWQACAVFEGFGTAPGLGGKVRRV